jgi:ATP-dependent protease ClpP protease subunit
LKDPRTRIKPALHNDKRQWYRIENKKADRAVIDLFDEIGYDPWWDVGISTTDFVKELRAIKASTIELHINSLGGAAFDGVTIYNALRDHDARIEVVVDGLAASAASIVAMSGEKITMNRGSELMLHDASTIVWGNAAEMREVADLLDQLSSDLAAIYADRAGGTAAEWRDVMQGEAWFTAQEAVDAGLADEIVELKEDAEEAKNKFDLTIYAHAGRAKAPKPKLRATNRELPRDSVPADGAVAKPEDGMTPEQLEKIGLPEDATDEQISERLDELAANAEEKPGNGDVPDGDTTGGTGEGKGATGGETQTGENADGGTGRSASTTSWRWPAAGCGCAGCSRSSARTTPSARWPASRSTSGPWLRPTSHGGTALLTLGAWRPTAVLDARLSAPSGRAADDGRAPHRRGGHQRTGVTARWVCRPPYTVDGPAVRRR